MDNGRPEMGIASMREESQFGKREKGPWRSLFNEKKNRRRTGLVLFLFLTSVGRRADGPRIELPAKSWRFNSLLA